uniref:Uncharacterized protein n=1 Tax=Bionectria ochroleuca TaxID=29856 RepID=A0A8H7TNP0_BIOOC
MIAAARDLAWEEDPGRSSTFEHWCGYCIASYAPKTRLTSDGFEQWTKWPLCSLMAHPIWILQDQTGALLPTRTDTMVVRFLEGRSFNREIAVKLSEKQVQIGSWSQPLHVNIKMPTHAMRQVSKMLPAPQ